jgi:hypothetical protein
MSHHTHLVQLALFFWMPAPFLYSSVWPYQPVAIALLVYIQLTWGSAPPSLSRIVCLTSVAVGAFPSLSMLGGLCHICLLGLAVYL